jgi:hypothetical protein
MSAIAIYGATDRFNYGDLLFPIVLCEALRRRLPNRIVENYAVIDSDFGNKGGLPTEGFSKLVSQLERGEVGRLVVAGGQVLDARWGAILGYLLPSKLDLTIRALRRLLGAGLTDRLARSAVSSNWSQPFVVPEKLAEMVPVAYNSVGGAEINLLSAGLKEKLICSMRAADYVSVRDNATHLAFQTLGVESELVPDSAVLMSSFFSGSYLRMSSRDLIASYVEDNAGRYLVFQVGIKFGRGVEEKIAERISRLAIKHDLKVVLLAIGTATAHEDDVVLRRIQTFMDNRVSCIDLYDGSVFEIMHVIAHAGAYIGTSLPFTRRVTKLNEFLETWDIGEHKFSVDIDDDGDPMSQVMSVGAERRVRLASTLKELSQSSVEKVLGLTGGVK